jgi:putative ABC transport system ATP-binding protein
MTSLLALREVSKRYAEGAGYRQVLDSVSFEVVERETIGVLVTRRKGGKSTLLNILAGIECPDAGEVCWEGRDMVKLSVDKRTRVRRRRGIALANGDWRPVSSIPVLEYVASGLHSNGLTMGESESCAHVALERVNASALGHRSIQTLGVAERLHVELARALAGEPRVLLFDEPAMLPRVSEAREFYALLHSLPKRLGLALVIVSEELAALKGSQRVMHLADGRLTSTDERRNVVELFGEHREVS